jgi:molecular chaperone HtpG
MPDQQPDKQTYPISLHVPGILKLLGEHLYSEPRVALRELIQNAHDSCQRRLVEDPNLEGYRPRIDITLHPQQRLLKIQDNGSGLTHQEIQDYLATVGRGYTGELRERLEFGNRDEALALIGQFGLGLLSAFLVADRVEIITRSYQPEQPTWHWESAGEETYTLSPTERAEPGSTLTLHLKLAGEFLLNEEEVRKAIRNYADFLEIPIYVNRVETPVNVMNAPWHRDADLDAYRQYVTERFNTREPLTIISLYDHVEKLTNPDGTEDSLITPLSGVLFVPPRSVVSLTEYGDVSIYIQRMFITDNERELLPRWAKFVRGVVESPVLKPTVSRERVRRDDTFYRVQQAIESQLLAHLIKLAESDLKLWRSIVVAHSDLIKGWALESYTFFEAVCDYVTFDTSRGNLTLRDYLKVSGGHIYYYVEERGSTQEKMLYEAQGLVVIDASRFAEEGFLQGYALTHPGVEMYQLKPGADFVFTPVEKPAPNWKDITLYYNEQGIQTNVVKFVPESIPALLIHPPGSDEIAQARESLDDLSGPVARFVNEYLRRFDPDRKNTQGILHLNANNPLMKSLLKLSPAQEAFTAALEIIYHNARFFAGRTLTPHEAKQSFDMIGYSVEQLVKAVKQGKPDDDEWE